MQMGLAGFGYPWEDGEQAWLLHTQRVSEPGMHAKNTSSDGGVTAGPDGDLPPECLADPDSAFVDVDGVRVHYKEVGPLQVGGGGGGGRGRRAGRRGGGLAGGEVC
jgi:hypothetical protein